MNAPVPASETIHELETAHLRVIIRSLEVRIGIIESNHRGYAYTLAHRGMSERTRALYEKQQAERAYTLKLLTEARDHFAAML